MNVDKIVEKIVDFVKTNREMFGLDKYPHTKTLQIGGDQPKQLMVYNGETVEVIVCVGYIYFKSEKDELKLRDFSEGVVGIRKVGGEWRPQLLLDIKSKMTVTLNSGVESVNVEIDLND